MRTSNTIEAAGTARRDPWTLNASPRWLSLGLDDEQRVRLPDDTNLDYLEAQIKAAMRNNDCLLVELYPDERAAQRRIILNGPALAFVVLIEGDDAPSL